MPEIVVVSDSHLSPRTPEAVANWNAVVALVQKTKPDLVVHAGDLTLDGLHEPSELAYGRALLDRLPVPWLAVPGNHDVGDIGGTANPINDARRTAFESDIGPRFWSHNLGRWRLIGFDSQDLLADEAHGQHVIDRLAAEVTGPGPIALFQHRPLLPVDDAEGDIPRRYITEPARTALRAIMNRAEVKLVVSGHVHQWRSHVIDSTHHVWAPSTWAAITDQWQPVIGAKLVGVARILLDDDVRADTTDQAGIKSEAIVPDGIVNNIMGETLASPYR